MPQPSGQVLVDSGHSLAGTLFAYAHNNGGGGGMWDATNGAMLTKVGTGAVATEGGATVVTSASNTYYTLASPITPGAGAFSIGFRSRMTANDARSIFCGNHTATTSYIWLNSSGQARIQGTNIGANGGVTSLSTWWIVRDGIYAAARVYKDGVLVGSVTNSQGTAVTISAILRGLSGGTTNDFHGSAEFFHLFSGTALTLAQIESLTADPYQMLQSAGGVDATASGATVSATAALVAGAVSGGSSGVAGGVVITASAALVAGSASGGAGSSITITSPAPYQAAQRNVGAGSASVTIAGTSTATSAIEYRRGTGAWQTLVAAHPGGAYSATVTMPTGQVTLQVRHASDTEVTASVPLATVGDKFILIGQSNNVGVSPQVVPPVASSFTALQFDRSDTWKPLQEGDTQVTSFDGGSAGSKGSYVGALSNRLQANGVPVAFIPMAVGSTRVDQWQRYDPAPTDPYFNYGRALGQWQQAGGGRAAILWIGESDASSGTPVADYKAGMHAIIDDWWADTGTPVFLVMITNFHANAPAIRAAQLEIAAENPHVAGIADGGGAYSGDVHYLTTAQINAVADAIYPEFVDAFYSAGATAAGATITATASLQAGAAGGMGSATAPGITLEAVAQLLAGIASGGSASTAAGATLTATASLLPGAAAGQLSATASGALWSVVASLVAGGAIGDGSTIWPATRAGEAATARVPFDGVRVIVPDADDPAAPVKAIPLYVADTERLLIDWEAKYLPGAGDTTATLVALDAPAGVSVTPSVAPGSALTTGVVVLAVTPTGAAGTYRVALRISTAGGRESTALVDVVVSATVQSAKTFRLRSTADRDVFDLDFAAKYLAGAADVADVLLSTSADAGLTADARLDVGGVVQVAVDNPDAPGTYQVRTQLQTAAGRRKTGAIAVEVLA